MSSAQAGEPVAPRSRPFDASIIVASQGTEKDLRRTLESAARDSGSRAEVIVAHAGAPLDAEGLSGDFPNLVLLYAPPGASVPELRYLALDRASGRIVAMTEASAVFPGDWFDALLRAHEQGFEAVGGPIDPDPEFDLVSWSAHVAEYGRYMSPVTAGPGNEFSGYNASYDRTVLDRCETAVGGRHWEHVLHEEARTLGARFLLLDSMRLVNTRRHRIGDFLRQRFAYGRGYGRVRGARSGLGAHALLSVAVVALPLLMLGRFARWMADKRLPIGRSVAAMPLLLLFASAWSLGEGVGYLDAMGQRLRTGEARDAEGRG